MTRTDPALSPVSALLAAACVLATSGCAIMTEHQKADTSGRFEDAIRLSEADIADPARAPTAKLWPLCRAYAGAKRYKKLSACLDQLEGNISAGDKNGIEDPEEQIKRGAPLLYAIGTLGESMAKGITGDKRPKAKWILDVSPEPHLLRAQAMTDLGDYRAALAEAQKALQAARSASSSRAFVMNQAGSYAFKAYGIAAVVHGLSGNRAAARQMVTAMERYKRPPDDETGALYAYYEVYARAYIALGEYQQALDLLTQQFEPLVLKALGPIVGSMFGFSYRELMLGGEIPRTFLLNKCRFETGRIAEAKQGYDELLGIPQTRQNGEIYWPILYDRGRIAAMEGDFAAAIEFWRRAIEVIEEQRATINTEASKIGFAGDKQAVYQSLVAALVSAQRDAEAFDYVERSKSRALVDLLAGKNDFSVAAPNEAELRSLLTEIKDTEYDHRTSAQPAATGRSRSERTLQLRQRLAQGAPELHSLVSVSSVPIGEIQARLEPDEALIEYYYDDKALFAFVLTRQALKTTRLDVAGLANDVRALRKAVELPVGTEYEVPARALHSRLIRPIETQLQGTSKLLIVPHGVLHYLPFAVLETGGNYVADRYSLRFLPSASVTRYLQRPVKSVQAGVLAFGNPDLGDPAKDLQFAQEEAIAVAQKVPRSRALVRKDATESALRQYAAAFEYIHFATHGEFNSDRPLESAVLLAKDTRSDGLLTVGKLYSIRLGAELVTLSACETGLGRIASGDDVVGLTRGFLYAGASTVVASLWKVDDRATAELMTRFYDGLRSGGKREALRSAQLATRGKYPHPFFWAAFQLNGAP